MPSATQQQDFYRVGTFGLPIRFTLLDRLNNPLLLDNTVLGITLTFVRPDQTMFVRQLTLPGAIYDPNGVIQYVVEDGDLTLSGGYEIDIVITYADASLPLKASMQVLR